MNNLLKYTIAIITIILSIVACETDFENVGAELIDNNTFDTDKAIFEVNAFTKNVLKSRVENTPVHTLGVYKTTNFGLLNAGVVTQLSVPAVVDYGLNPTIDSVIVDIPYNATSDGVYDDNKPKFILNNIYGNQETEFNIKISRLETFLNSLDPENPTQIKKYYSNRTYNTSTELFSGGFKPNKNDTVAYISRPDIFDTSVNIDTIIKSDSAPSIKLGLDKGFFTDNFLLDDENDLNSVNFESQEKFVQFFNGLLFESEGDDGSIMLLNFAGATLNIYYTNEILTNETIEDSEGNIISETDYNGDGDFEDNDQPVKTKQSIVFGFNGIRTNTFERNYSNSTIDQVFDNPNQSKKLYIQGAQGSIVSLDAFNNMDLDAIRNENWLINEANLVFNVDKDASGDVVPTRLFLYKLDEDGDTSNNNAQILDILSVGEATYDGNLQSEEDDGNDETTEGPVKYRFRITDYLSEVLKNEDATQPVNFGIKAFHVSDLPNLQFAEDTIVREFSWDPRGVVLYGNDYLPTDPDYDKRLKLEIYYTKLNE